MARWRWGPCVRAGCSGAERRGRRRLLGAWACVALALGLSCAPAPQKKLIEFGWDEPDTAFLRRHIGRMEQMPFDGCVFHVLLEPQQGRCVNLAWRFWGREGFPATSARQAREDLWRTPRRRLRHNFLRLNVTPGDVDWYEDFSPILANARLAASLARESGCDGILLDTESYQAPVFDYRARPAAARRPFADYAAQTRQRGQELMHAFEQGFPDLRVLLTFGYELPWLESSAGARPLAECRNGLLAPFLDGLIAGCRRGRIVDAYELSYGTREPRGFSAAYRTLREGLLPIVASPERYRTSVSFGFGLWLDYDWRRNGWSGTAPASNYFTPEVLERSLTAALERADEYVWIYSETPRWWTADGSPRELPPDYIAALRRARQSAGLD